MCLAIPAKVLKIEGKRAEVDMGGVRREVNITLTPGVEVGNYVIVHAGYAINILDEEEAEETLRLLEELGEIH